MRDLVAYTLFVLGGLMTAAQHHGTTGIPVGEKVPDFVVTALDGRAQKLSDLQKDSQGKPRPVVLTFWCTFCGSCREVDARLAAFAKAQSATAGIFVLDASANETPEKINAFLKKKDLALSVLTDSSAKSADLFGAKVTTTTVVIDAQGTLRYRGRFGRATESFAEDALKAVLAGQEVKVKEPGFYG